MGRRPKTKNDYVCMTKEKKKKKKTEKVQYFGVPFVL